MKTQQKRKGGRKRVQGHRKHRLSALCEHFTESNLPHPELCFIPQRLRALAVETDCLGFERAEVIPLSSPPFLSEKRSSLYLPSKELVRIEVTRNKDVGQA